MRLMLNCDDVFEALTRGPLLVGEENEALEQHLGECGECRALAEEFAPGASLLNVELAATEDEDSRSLAERVFSRFEAQRALAPARHFLAINSQTWTQLAAAAAVLIALGTLIWAVAPGDSRLPQEQAILSAFASPLAPGGQPDEHGLLHLASLNLPRLCLTAVPASDAKEAMQCCTRCHHAGDSVPAVRIVAFSQQSCLACHKS